MHCEDCSKLRTSELMDDGADTGFIGSLTDQPAEIRRMKFPVATRCGPDLVMKLLHLGIFFGQRFWLRCRCWSRA